ncbi:MAG TPA: alpha-glucan family phosphorylase [Firmicutes bacterium]|jgi:starch phosphorylase|nr:alpha-glucan family phosphorylase [Bacillota bacterium]
MKQNALPKVAYFCMEYGLNHEFPIYSGGLGILAGDHLKSAGDLKVPLVAVGILWRQGYTEQRIGPDGRPYDIFTDHSYDFLEDTGVKVNVTVRGNQVTCKVWKTEHFGNAPLYLLDTNLPENEEPWITDRLYSGSGDDRIAQEIVLGIGGIRALRALGILPDVYHFNEGHAVLAGIELIREKMTQGLDFKAAWEKTRQEIVFTTHTPVPAGNESHTLAALEYVGAFNGLTAEQMKAIGGNPFNMTVAGLRLSRLANAVAQLHGKTACKMWANVKDAAPIIAITNGVHPGTWQNPAIRQAFADGASLWEPHQKAKRLLIQEIEKQTGVKLHEDKLLIGFARRAAAYKRADLIFRNESIIKPLLEQGQIQLVFSGKAHPQDGIGKDLVARTVAMAKRYPKSVVFIENYDMRIGRLLTQGCDVWLNNPQRPLEACGTSGMKAAMNGVLNLSILDGWWPEGCEHGVNGWQIGNAYEGPGQDENDLKSLYQTLTKEVLPTYYGQKDMWERMMRASIKMSEYFSSHRMVEEYYERLYRPNNSEMACNA